MMYRTFLVFVAVVGLCQQSAAATAPNPQLRPRNKSARSLTGVERSTSAAAPDIHRSRTSHRRLGKDRLTPAPSASFAPSVAPFGAPSSFPSGVPTAAPSMVPSSPPSSLPSSVASEVPSVSPSFAPTTAQPSEGPSVTPSSTPSVSMAPTEPPSISRSPSAAPSDAPSTAPSTSSAPTATPAPTGAPFTPVPTGAPSTPVPSLAPVETATTTTTASPSDAPTNSVVALLGFSFTFTADDTNPVDQEELTTTLEEYLTAGMLQAYPNAVAVTLQQRTRRQLHESSPLRKSQRQRRQLQESSRTVDYSGFVVFSGTAPPVMDVQALQQTLLEDQTAVQEALDANPDLQSKNAVVEKVVFDAVVNPDDSDPNDSGDSDNDNNAAVIGGVVGGSVFTLAAVALLMSRRRSNPLDDDDDDDDDDEQPPPPPPPRPKDVAGDLQGQGVPSSESPTANSTAHGAAPTPPAPLVPDGPVRAKQQQQTDVDYVLQPSGSMPAPTPASDDALAAATASVDEFAAAYSVMRRTHTVPPETTNTTTTPQKITPQKTPVKTASENYNNEPKMMAISPLTPALSVDSDDMDRYSLGGGGGADAATTKALDYSPVPNKQAAAAMAISEEEEEEEDAYNSDNESYLTHGNVSVVGGGVSAMMDPMKEDDDDNESQPPKLSMVKPAMSGQRYPYNTDNADKAAGNTNPRPEMDSGQPFDEANDDMEQDLDVFAAELERAKATSSPFSSKASGADSPSSSVKSQFAKNREAFEAASKAKAIGRAPVMQNNEDDY